MSIARRKSVKRFETEALNFSERIALAGGSISVASLDAINVFVQDLKAAALWAKLVDVGPFVGDQLAASLVKLKYPAGVASTLTNNNFVAGDYTEVTGLNGNGTTKYLQTGINMEDHLIHADGTLAIYSRSAVLADATPRIALGNSNAFLGANFDGQVIEFDWDSATGAGLSDSGAPGFYAGVVQQVEQRQRIYRNNVLTTLGAVTGAAGEDLVTVFAGNTLGVAANFWSGRLSFYALATWLTAAEVATLYGTVQKLQIALGRNV